MISERYLCRLSVRISWINVLRLAAVMAVRSRLINAVFFFSDESSDLLTSKTPVHFRQPCFLPRSSTRKPTFLSIPHSPVQVAQLAFNPLLAGFLHPPHIRAARLRFLLRSIFAFSCRPFPNFYTRPSRACLACCVFLRYWYPTSLFPHITPRVA